MNIIYEFIFVSIFFLIVYLFKLKKKEGKGVKKAKKRAKKRAKKERKKERKKVKKRAIKIEKKNPKKFDFIRDVKKSIYFWKFFFSFKWFRFNNKNNERNWTDIIPDVFNFILIVIKKLWNILIIIKDFYKVFKSLFIFLIFIFYWILCLLTGLIICSIQFFIFVGENVKKLGGLI